MCVCLGVGWGGPCTGSIWDIGRFDWECVRVYDGCMGYVGGDL